MIKIIGGMAMNNTINVNFMTKAYNNFLKSYEASHSTGKSFMDSVEEMSAAKGASGTGAVSTKDMTMEEYKQYIYDKISSLPMEPSHMQDNISIHISDAGFEAMKNDPEYEKWVLDWLGKDFMTYNPWTAVCGGSYTVHYIGATKEEYHGEGWYAGYQHGKGKSLFNEKSKDSFWEQRIEREKRIKEEYEESLEKKALIKKWQQGRFNSELMIKRAEKSRLINSGYSENSISQASAAYEANVMAEPVANGVFDSTATVPNV